MNVLPDLVRGRINAQLAELSLKHGRAVGVRDFDPELIGPTVLRLMITSTADDVFSVDVDISRVIALSQANCGSPN